jgi:hypothetical protein
MGFSVRALPALPLTVEYERNYAVVSAVRVSGDVVFKFRHPREGEFQKFPKKVGRRVIDPFVLRDRFLAVRTPDEALEVLDHGGYFRRLYETDGKPSRRSKELTWTDLKGWQELLRFLSTNAPIPDYPLDRSEWNGAYQEMLQEGLPLPLVDVAKHLKDYEACWAFGRPDNLTIRSSAESPADARPTLSAAITIHSCLEAMLAAIYVDRLVGVKLELCSLGDCQNLYEVTSRHQRRYCSQACAHKASVRRKRAEANAKKSSSSTNSRRKNP